MSYSNFYNSYQYGNNDGGKQNSNNNNYAGTRQPIQPPPHGYMEATYDWNNQGASSTTGFNNQSLNNPRINTNNNGVYSNSHNYPSHSGDLSNSLNNNQVAQPQEDKLQSSGLNRLVYASALESAIRNTPDQSGYNSSRQDGRGSYQAPGRTGSQNYSPQTSNHTSAAASGRTGSYDSQSERPGFLSQSNSASHGHPAHQTPSNNTSQISQQQRNPPPRAKPQMQPQQWSNSQRTPLLPHSMANMTSTQPHTHASFPSDRSAQNENLPRMSNSKTTPASMTYGRPGGHDNRPDTPPQRSSAETASSHQISPPKVQFINPSELYNQQYLLAQERSKAAEAEAAAERQRQEEEAKAQGEAATAGNASTPTKTKRVKRIAPKKEANDKAPAPELEAQEGGDDMAVEMQRMLEKLKGMRAKDPSLFSKLWDDIKKAPAAGQQAPTQGQQNTNSSSSAARTATEAASMTANETPMSASEKKGIPQNPLIDGMPDSGRFPAQRHRRKGKDEQGGTALATEANVNYMLNQAPDSLSAVEQLASITHPEPALDNQTGSTSTQTATQDATWPASTQQKLASAASQYLTKNPTNLEKQCSPEALMLLLRNNPTYPDLCVQLESRGFILDRQALARYLLAAVPALASGNNASQETKKAEPNGQLPASVPTLTQPTQQVPQPPPLPGAAAPAKPKPRPMKTAQASGPPSLEHPSQPPRAEMLVWDGKSGLTSSMPLENGRLSTSAPPKNKAFSSRRKPAVPILPTPPVLGPKAEKAKKRLFSEIVDLSQLSSDEEDIDELSEDESFPRLSKLPRVEGPSVERQLDHTFDQDSMDIDTTSPPPFERQRSGSPVIGDSHIAEPDFEDFDPDDEQCLREIKNFPRISKLFEPSAALERVYYNPKTAARDILIAAGRHPSERPLNYHLAKFPEIFAGVRSKSDLESFRWDLVDPGGPSMPVVPVEDILAEPPRVPRKRRRDKKSRADTGDDKSGPTADALNLNNAQASSNPLSSPLLPHSSSFSTPQNPRTSMAGAPTSGRGSDRRGRPPGAKNKNPTKVATKAGSVSARNATAAPVRQAVPEPLYPVFTCEWASCPAQLHDVHTLERHIDKVHVVGQTHCQWNGCPNTSTQYVGDGLGEHVHQAHIEPLAWTYGDGPAVKATVTKLDRYLNANGSIVTPDASTAGEGDSLIYPVESKSSIKAFYKVHGIEKPKDQAQEVLLAVRRRQQRVGVGLEQEGCEFSNPKRNKAIVNDEEFYQVVSEEEEDGDNWFQRDDSP